MAVKPITTLPTEHDAYIRRIMTETFDRQVKSLTRFSRGNNNATFLVNLQASDASWRDFVYGTEQQPGTSPLPADVLTAVIRISDTKSLLDETNRTQNEVAAMVMFRDALSGSKFDGIVPMVYGWALSSTDSNGAYVPGWIVMEHMPGKDMGEVMEKTSVWKRGPMAKQIADLLSLIQSYKLPETVMGYGGFTFNGDGDVVAGRTSIPCGGPFRTLTAMVQANLRKQLELADSPDAHIVNGWKNAPGNLRQRIEKFAARGVQGVVAECAVDRPTLMHGDLDGFNLLIDEQKNISALLDFDFSSIATPADEFMMSFASYHYVVQGPFDDTHPDKSKLREFQLHGFPAELPRSRRDWDLAAVFSKALDEAGCLTPRTIPGMDDYSSLFYFLQNVCPPYFMMRNFMNRHTPEQVEQLRLKAEKALDLFLKQWGF